MTAHRDVIASVPPCALAKGERVLIHNAAPGGSLRLSHEDGDATTAIRQLDHVSKERPILALPRTRQRSPSQEGCGGRVLTQQHRRSLHGGWASQGHAPLGVLLGRWRPTSPRHVPTGSSHLNLHTRAPGLGVAQSLAVVTCGPWPWAQEEVVRREPCAGPCAIGVPLLTAGNISSDGRENVDGIQAALRKRLCIPRGVSPSSKARPHGAFRQHASH